MVTKTKKATKPKKGFTLSKHEINAMLLEVEEYIPFLKNSVKITQKMIDESEDGDIPQNLLGYNVKRKTVGDHDYDSQMVKYTFTFTSPDGKKTVINTTMCLMIGWNFHEDVTFQ